MNMGSQENQKDKGGNMNFENEGFSVADTKIIRNNGHYEKHTWLRGHYPDLGKPIEGWTGRETVVKRTVVVPTVIFEVGEK